MAAVHYRDKRRARKAAGNSHAQPYVATPPQRTQLPRLVSVGTVGGLVPPPSASPSLSVLVAGRYEVRVGSGFDAPTLAELIRTLEQLA